MKGYDIAMTVRGVTFRIDTQCFMIANTEIDESDPDSSSHRVFIAEMLEIALGKLSKGSSDGIEECDRRLRRVRSVAVGEIKRMVNDADRERTSCRDMLMSVHSDLDAANAEIQRLKAELDSANNNLVSLRKYRFALEDIETDDMGNPQERKSRG